MKALVVDDSRAMRSIIKKFLKAQGFDVLVEAGDGREALERLKESWPVDLALIDWNMPVMDGLELVIAVRQDKSLDTIRLMMVTTESEMAKMAHALEAGANEYIMKPFTTEALRDKLDILGFERPNA